MKNKIGLTFKTLCIIAALILSLSANARGPTLAVLYPDVREPYRSIFGDIIKGISREANGKVRMYAIRAGDDIEELESWLNKANPEVVISLGSRVKSVVTQLPTGLNVVTGAALLSDKDIKHGIVGISLAPSPKMLFTKLKELVPDIRRVSVVYHEESNGWLVRLASKAAKELDLELVTVPADGARDAAKTYQKLLSEQVSGADAIWLLQADPTLDEKGMLPRLMSEAWDRHTVVFSSNPSHVKRGALFSLFPDNIQMGKSLSKKAGLVARGESKTVEALENLLIAVNVRTAEHLKLKITRSQMREFNLIFPDR